MRDSSNDLIPYYYLLIICSISWGIAFGIRRISFPNIPLFDFTKIIQSIYGKHVLTYNAFFSVFFGPFLGATCGSLGLIMLNFYAGFNSIFFIMVFAAFAFYKANTKEARERYGSDRRDYKDDTAPVAKNSYQDLEKTSFLSVVTLAACQTMLIVIYLFVLEEKHEMIDYSKSSTFLKYFVGAFTQFVHGHTCFNDKVLEEAIFWEKVLTIARVNGGKIRVRRSGNIDECTGVITTQQLRWRQCLSNCINIYGYLLVGFLIPMYLAKEEEWKDVVFNLMSGYFIVSFDDCGAKVIEIELDPDEETGRLTSTQQKVTPDVEKTGISGHVVYDLGSSNSQLNVTEDQV